MDLSIIIVNYCTYEFTKQTIESVISKDHNFSYQIYLVDNASPDDSLKKLQNDFSQEMSNGLIHFIINPENSGFAHANNQALKKLNSDYILLLNSDTVVVDDCLDKSMDKIKNNLSIGALGCKVLLPDGSLDRACRRSFPTFSASFYKMTGLSRIFPKSQRFGRYNLTYLDENGTYEVDCLMGAFMLLRKPVVDEVGLLDETFFMYGEDIDWCFRIKEAGWKIMYYGDPQIIHHKGASGSSGKQKKRTIYEFYRAMYIFYNKHYKDSYPLIITYITYIGIWAQCRLKMLLNSL